jgi:hypothetical protein
MRPFLNPLTGPCALQIIADNLALCVMLEDEHIQSMLSLAAKHHNPEIMRLLYHAVKVPKDNLPIKHNQHLVIKFLMQRRNEVPKTGKERDAIATERREQYAHGHAPGHTHSRLYPWMCVGSD